MTVEPAPEALELVVYSRETPCPFITLARRVLAQDGVLYRELFIDRDKLAERRVLEWTGFLSVPTLVAAIPGETLPFEAPTPLAPGSSPRGIDRGALITEPDEAQLRTWLRRIGLLSPAIS